MCVSHFVFHPKHTHSLGALKMVTPRAVRTPPTRVGHRNEAEKSRNGTVVCLRTTEIVWWTNVCVMMAARRVFPFLRTHCVAKKGTPACACVRWLEWVAILLRSIKRKQLAGKVFYVARPILRRCRNSQSFSIQPPTLVFLIDAQS